MSQVAQNGKKKSPAKSPEMRSHIYPEIEFACWVNTLVCGGVTTFKSSTYYDLPDPGSSNHRKLNGSIENRRLSQPNQPQI